MTVFDFSYDTTSRSIEIVAFNSTTGAPETLAYNASGLTATYQRHAGGRPTQSAQSITLATLATTQTAYSSGGFIHKADGVHRLDLPNAAIARGSDGADSVVVSLAKSGISFVTPRVKLREPVLSQNEIEQIRYRLGLDGTTDEPTAASAQLGSPDVRVTYGVFAATSGGLVNSTITVLEATLWEIPLDGVTIASRFEKVLFTVKSSADDVDNDSVLQILVSQAPNGSTDGIIRLNKQAGGSNRTKATTTITAGEATIVVDPAIAAVIASGSYVWELKGIDAGATPYADASVIAQGSFIVNKVVTKAVS